MNRTRRDILEVAWLIMCIAVVGNVAWNRPDLRPVAWVIAITAPIGTALYVMHRIKDTK